MVTWEIHDPNSIPNQQLKISTNAFIKSKKNQELQDKRKHNASYSLGVKTTTLKDNHKASREGKKRG
jgi:hypothetical protein